MKDFDPEEEKKINPCTQGSKDYKEGNDKYLITYQCESCGHTWDVCLLSYEYPEVCPTNKDHKNIHIQGYKTRIPNAKFIADFINQHYKIIFIIEKIPEKPKEHIMGKFYVFNEKDGIWDQNLAEIIINKEAKAILGEKLKITDTGNIKLHLTIIAKKYLENGERIKLYGPVKQEGNGIKINFRNGTLFIQPELEEINGKLYLKAITYSFYKHKPEDYFERALPWDFDPSRNRNPKKILDFLWYISNDNVFNFITLLEGMAWPFLPGYPIQQALVLVGPGNNGKSTYLQIIKMLVGKENVSTLTLQQLSMAGSGRPFQIVELENKLVNIADDLPNKPLADTGYYKQLTGGSIVEGERKFGSMFKIENQAKMYFSANRMPEVNEDTLAWWRRFCFVILEKIIENPKEMQLVLKEFEIEIPDLINFLIFAVLPNMIGKTTFTFSDNPDLTKKTYENASNTSIRFAEEKLEYNPEAETLKGDIWEEYKAWCERHNLTVESERKFWITIYSKFPKAEEKRKQDQGVLKRSIKGLELIKEDPINDLESIIIEEKKKLLENYIQDLISLKDKIKVDNITTITTFSGIFNYIHEYLNFLYLVKGNGGYGGYSGNEQSISEKSLEKEIFENTGSLENIQNEIYNSDKIAGISEETKNQEGKIENFPNINEPIQSEISNSENLGNLPKPEEPMISNSNKDQGSIPKTRKKYGKFLAFWDLNDLNEFLKPHDDLKVIKWIPSPMSNIIEATLNKTWNQISKETQDLLKNNFDFIYSGDYGEIRILALIENLDQGQEVN